MSGKRRWSKSPELSIPQRPKQVGKRPFVQNRTTQAPVKFGDPLPPPNVATAIVSSDADWQRYLSHFRTLQSAEERHSAVQTARQTAGNSQRAMDLAGLRERLEGR